MSGHDLSIPASPKLRSLASVGWFAVMAVVWLAMAMFAVVMLAAMLISDVAGYLRSALHLGPVQTTPRAPYRIARIF